jgi:hypothetical protein
MLGHDRWIEMSDKLQFVGVHRALSEGSPLLGDDKPNFVGHLDTEPVPTFDMVCASR